MNAVTLARAILRCYPRAWRERYEPEVSALVTEGRCRVVDLFDLARGCVSEWASDDPTVRLVSRTLDLVATGAFAATAAAVLGLALARLAPTGLGSDEVVTLTALPGLLVLWQIGAERRRAEWDPNCRMLETWRLTRREAVVWRTTIVVGGALGIATSVAGVVLSLPALVALLVFAIAMPSAVVVHQTSVAGFDGRRFPLGLGGPAAGV